MTLASAINRAQTEAKAYGDSRAVVKYPTPFSDGTEYATFAVTDPRIDRARADKLIVLVSLKDGLLVNP